MTDTISAAMKNTLAFTLFLFVLHSSFAQDKQRIKAFKKELKPLELTFDMPEGWTTTEVKENRDLGYTFAILNKDKTLETRYSLFGLKNLMKEYEASLKDSNSVMLHPNKFYLGFVQANMLNMTGGNMVEIQKFPHQAVSTEFNADAGGTYFLEFNCEFGEGYKYGLIVYIHRDDVADVIITYMSDDPLAMQEQMMDAFHALKFD